jgi:hypothetical protein
MAAYQTLNAGTFRLLWRFERWLRGEQAFR